MNRVYPNRIDWENEPSTNTPINETNLNKIDYAVYEIDGRVVTFDLTKANQSDLLQTVKTVTYDTETGIFTFTFWNDSTVTADLNIEKIPVSFSMSPEGIITMTTADGTQYTCDISTLIKIYTFTDSSEIDFTIATDASGNKNITAQIKAGSITGNKLQPNYLADCVDAKNSAENAEREAGLYATDAYNDKLISEGFAVGEQNGVPVEQGSPYYHNNSKYWSQQSNPTKFSSLSDVNFGTLEDDDIPVYDATSEKWVNEVGVSTEIKNASVVSGETKIRTRTGGILQSCVVELEPVQSGSGTPSPSNVRPITGHSSVEVVNHKKNLVPFDIPTMKTLNTASAWVGNSMTYNGVTWALNEDGTIDISGTATGNSTIIFQDIPVDSSKGNIIISGLKGNTSNIIWDTTSVLEDINGNVLYTIWSSSTNENTVIDLSNYPTAHHIYLRIKRKSNTLVSGTAKIQVEYGSTATEFEPYQGQDITIPLGQTVYGGSLDVVSGVLTVDKKYKYVDGSDTSFLSVASGQLQIAIDNDSITNTDSYHSTGKLICNRFVEIFNNSSSQEGIYYRANGSHNLLVRGNNYTSETTLSDWVTWLSSNPLQIVYWLATPATVQLTPQQINTLIGENHIDVPLEGQSLDSLSYREMFAWDDVTDVVKAVDDKNADVSAIGTDESGRTTASKAYAVGEHFYKDGKFGKTKTAVAEGATWTLNTNYEESTIAEEFNKVSSSTATAVSGVTTVSSSLVLKFGRVVIFKCSFTLLNNITSDNTTTILKTPFSAYSSLLPVVTFNTSSPPYKNLDTIGWIDGTDVRLRDNLNAGSYQAYCVYICQ